MPDLWESSGERTQGPLLSQGVVIRRDTKEDFKKKGRRRAKRTIQ